MVINIPDQIIREFLSGVSAVLAVIAMGTFLWFILRGIARKFTFTRMTLVLALAPLSLINFLGDSSALLIYAVATILLGIAIDGINHLLMPNEQSQTTQNPVKQAEETVESNPGIIVWEKAVKKCIHLVYIFLIIMTVLFMSTFWILVENTHLIGNYHKAKSMKILKSMEAEVLRDEIEDMKEFIKNNCQTSP